ncbi:MAG: hypothetical protein ABI771_13340 [Betaproteobacteria bacterium]
MKFGTPVMALAFSLFASAVWADTTQNDATPANDRAAVTTDGANGEQSWKIVDGHSANGQNAATQDEQRASRQAEQGSESAAASGQGEQDQNAQPDQVRSDQTTAGTTDGEQDTSAAKQDDDGATDGNAAVPSGDENADEQSAGVAQDGSDMMAALPDRSADDASQALSVQAQAFQKFMESVQGKLVVILPQGWSGSVPNLIESLKGSSDNTEVVVLSQRDDASNTSAPSSDDEDDNDDDDDDDDNS